MTARARVPRAWSGSTRRGRPSTSGTAGSCSSCCGSLRARAEPVVRTASPRRAAAGHELRPGPRTDAAGLRCSRGRPAGRRLVTSGIISRSRSTCAPRSPACRRSSPSCPRACGLSAPADHRAGHHPGAVLRRVLRCRGAAEPPVRRRAGAAGARSAWWPPGWCCAARCRILLFPGTVLAARAIALMNVLLPSLVKRRQPDRAGLLIGVYLLSLAVGVGPGLAAGGAGYQYAAHAPWLGGSVPLRPVDVGRAGGSGGRWSGCRSGATGPAPAGPAARGSTAVAEVVQARAGLAGHRVHGPAEPVYYATLSWLPRCCGTAARPPRTPARCSR